MGFRGRSRSGPQMGLRIASRGIAWGQLMVEVGGRMRELESDQGGSHESHLDSHQRREKNAQVL